jgi:hypothetical protein
VLLRAVLGFVRMLKVADDDLCTTRSLQARLASLRLLYACLHAVYVCACVLSLVQDGWSHGGLHAHVREKISSLMALD